MERLAEWQILLTKGRVERLEELVAMQSQPHGDAEVVLEDRQQETKEQRKQRKKNKKKGKGKGKGKRKAKKKKSTAKSEL